MIQTNNSVSLFDQYITTTDSLSIEPVHHMQIKIHIMATN